MRGKMSSESLDFDSVLEQSVIYLLSEDRRTADAAAIAPASIPEIRLPPLERRCKPRSTRDPLEQRAIEQMLVEVSTRHYAVAGTSRATQSKGHRQERGHRTFRRYGIPPQATPGPPLMLSD
jgi:hypothetical protein